MPDERPPDSVPWFANSSIRWAIGIAISGLYGMLAGACEMGWFCLRITEKGFSLLVGGAVSFAGAGIWAYRRVKLGNDPAVPLPKITAK